MHFVHVIFLTLARSQGVIYPWVISKYMELEIPESLELEHEELHRQLVDAVKEGGKAGEAAKAVAEVLHPHFEKEEVLTS